ncbi:hypothetical protein ABIE71_005314 [Bradyrhizobium diazoefficiens]
MRHGHQIGLGRQLVGLAAPITVLERTELPGFDELLQPCLQILEIAGRRQRPVRDRLRQRRGRPRIGRERGDDVDPVQRVKVIEMHDVVVHLQCKLHQIADRIGVLRNGDPERVLDRAHRRQCVGAGADAADPLGERPGVAGIAVLQDHFDPTPHRAGRDRIADHVVGVDIDLDPHVTFDTGHRIDDDALAGIVEIEAVGSLDTHCVPTLVFLFAQLLRSASSRLVASRFTAVTAACAATAAPTAPAATMPIWSAFFSMPNCLMLVRRS